MSDPSLPLADELRSTGPIRILFVDDEVNALDGLRRGLRGKRHEWDMVFAKGGAAAIEALAEGEFDVIVTDIQMSGVDGFEVLRFALERQPEALRLVLTGQNQFESALRAVTLAHQCLAKPCDRHELREAIERACNLRGLLSDRRLRATLSSIESLPTAPKLFIKISRLVEDENSGTAEIVALLEQDLAISAKLLQVVNSAFFGLPRNVTSLTDATNLLGQRVIRAMVLGEEAVRPFTGKGLFSAADLVREQQHGLKVARLAHRLAGGGALAESAFLAGMMHDLGWTVVGSLLPERYQSFMESHARGERGQDVERATLGAPHEAIGAFILGTWGLPLEVVEAVAYHAQPSCVPHAELNSITLVHVATALLHEIRCASGAEDSRPSGRGLDLSYVASLGLESEVPVWRATAADLVEQWESGGVG